MFILFLILLGLSAINPYNRSDWYFEAAVPLGGALILLFRYNKFRFTNFSYRLLFLESIFLLIGAHYTHAHVPLFDWIRDYFGLARNDYDRLAHFAVGFLLAIPFRELIIRLTLLRKKSASFFAVVSVLAMGAFYELTEWWVAITTSPGLGDAYLGTQGDVWDTQKDMLLDFVGAIVSTWSLGKVHDKILKK